MFQTLCDSVRKYPTQPKVLLCSTQRAGRLICQRLARELGGVINLRRATVFGLAAQVAFKARMKDGLSMIADAEGHLLIQSLLPQTLYYKDAQQLPGLSRALWKALKELRMSGITPDQIRAVPFSQPARLADLAFLLDQVGRKLKDNHQIDQAGMLELASQSVKDQPFPAIMFVPAALPLRPLEQSFLDSLKPTAIVELPAYFSTFTEDKPGEKSTPGARLPCTWGKATIAPHHPLSNLSSGTASVPSQREKLAGLIDLFLGVSPTAELLEVVRRLKSEDRLFEDIEISLGQARDQADLLTALLETHQIPYAIAFAQPISVFRAGRFMDSLARWVEEDFPASGLLAMLEQGDMRLFSPSKAKSSDDKHRKPGHSACIKIIRGSHALGGRDGYHAPFDAFALQQRDKGRGSFALAITHVQARITRRIALIPHRAPISTFLQGLATLFERTLRVTGPTDHVIARRIKIQLAALGKGIDDEMDRPEAMIWIRGALRDLTYQLPLEPAGKILITDQATCGLAGRPRLFLTGLSHDAASGRGLNDPVLPEALRPILKPLKTSLLDRQERLARLYSSWGGLPKDTRVTLSVASFDQGNRTVSPAVPFLHVLKALHGHLQADWRKLPGTPALPIAGESVQRHDRSAPGEASCLLTRSDILLQACAGEAFSPSARCRSAYSLMPSLRDHFTRSMERSHSDLDISSHPAWKPEFIDFRLNGRPLSPSGIEGLGGCHIRLFYRYLLHCMPWETPVMGPAQTGRWLDHFQRGNVLHEIFELFLREAPWPVTEEQRPLLLRLTDEVLVRWKASVPPPDPATYAHEARDVTDDALFFFSKQMNGEPGKGRPVGFEVTFGMPLPLAKKDPLDLAQAEPLPFALPDGHQSVNLQGRIDRVDQGEDGLWIIDYKTGKSENYLNAGSHSSRAELQMALYAVVVEQLAHLKGLTNTRVAGSGLYFPTQRGEGAFLELPVDEARKIVDQALETAFDELADGRFRAGDDECSNCNMHPICPYVQPHALPDSAAAAKTEA